MQLGDAYALNQIIVFHENKQLVFWSVLKVA